MKAPALLPLFLLSASLLMPLQLQGQSFKVFNDYIPNPDAWRPTRPTTTDVDAQGDLNFSLPILTIPGRNSLDYRVHFSYRSSIKAKQEASWIGLGWSFDPGSIVRDVQGGIYLDNKIYNVDYADTPKIQPDIYYVTTPAGSFAMTRISAFENGVGIPTRSKITNYPFIPDIWRPWKITYETPAIVEVESYQTGIVDGPPEYLESKEDFPGFVLTDEHGTRYLFKAPTLATYTGIHHGIYNNALAKTKEYYVNTWRLVAILGPDYPGDTEPGSFSQGSWIKLEYGVVNTTVLNTSSDPDILQAQCLTAIETPTHRAEFYQGIRPERAAEDYPWKDYIHCALDSIVLFAKGPSGNKRIRKVELMRPEEGEHHCGPWTYRLKLAGIQFYGASSEYVDPPYHFDYHDLSCEENHQDDFGYYNSTANRYSGDLFDTDSNTEDGRAWSLSAITYPTGGQEKIEYENDKIEEGLSVPYDFFTYFHVLDSQQEDPVHVARYYYSFGNFNNGEDPGGNLRQGGARVKAIRRFLHAGDAQPVNVVQFEYGEGTVSGVPEYYKERHYGGIEEQLGSLFKSTSRGKEAIYYDRIKRLNDDGTYEETYYSKGLPIKTTLVSLNAVPDDLYKDLTFITGNQHINWGIPLQTHHGDGSGNVHRIIEYQHNLNTSLLKAAFSVIYNVPIDVFVPLEWRPANSLLAEITKERHGGGFQIVHSRQFGYDSVTEPQGTGLITSIEESAGGTIRTTQNTYGFQVADTTISNKFERPHLLSAIVRSDILGRLSGSAANKTSALPGASQAYYASSVTTWKEFSVEQDDPLGKKILHPYRTYQWLAQEPASSVPSFSAWGEAEASSPWQLQTTFKAYDAYGHVTEQQDALGRSTHFYYGDGNTCTSTGFSLHHAYLTCVKRGALFRKLNYDDRLRLSSVTTSNENSNFFFYDSFGRLDELRNAAGEVVAQYTYDLHAALPFTQTVTYRSTGTATTTTSYFDGFGRSTQTHVSEDDSVIISAVEYDTMGREWRIWKPYRMPVSTGYDPDFAAHAVAAYDDATAPYVEITYTEDGLARVASTALPYQGDMQPIVQQSYGFESLDGAELLQMQITTDEIDQQTTTYTDTFGNTHRLLAGFGSSAQTTTAFFHDAVGNILQVYPPNYFAPPEGSEPEGWVTHYTYDTLGRLTRKSTPDADGAYEYTYDANGNLRFVIDPRRQGEGGYLYTDYDSFDRVLETGLCPSGSPGSPDAQSNCSSPDEAVIYTYDDFGSVDVTIAGKVNTSNPLEHLTYVIFGGGSYQYFYDDEGRVSDLYIVLDEFGSGKLIEYAYDLQGNVTSVHYQRGEADEVELVYTYDQAGRLETVQSRTAEDAGLVTEAAYTYTPTNQVKTLQLGPPTAIPTTTYTYHIRDWLKQINDPEAGGITPFAMELDYEANGNVASMEWATISNNNPANHVRFDYGYDDLNRLIRADFLLNAGGSTWTNEDTYDVGIGAPIAYDPNGNITELRRNNPDFPSASDLSYHYQAGSNRLASVSGAVDASFLYDANGNMTQSRTASGMDYDRRNLPTTMTAGEDVLHFHYDADGQRVLKRLVTSSGETKTLYVRGIDGRVLAVYVDDGAGPQLEYWNILAGSAVIGRIVPPVGTN